MKIPNVVLTPGNPKGMTLLPAFANSCGGEIFQAKDLKKAGDTFCIYGFLYGQEKLFEKAKEYWHLDHGYFLRSDPCGHMRGYYRIVHNDVYFWDHSLPKDWDKFNNLGIKLDNWKKGGKYILLSPPSIYTYKVLGYKDHGDWITEVTTELKKYTDRPILVSSKANKVKLSGDIWCVVTAISNLQVDALIQGIPIITTHCNRVGSLSEIESPIYDREMLAKMAGQQWTLEQIKNGQAWKGLNS